MKTNAVPMMVAIVIPDIGLLLDPIKPTIRLATVTKKNPKIMTNTPIQNLLVMESPGICGSKAMTPTKAKLPRITTRIERSFSVRT